MHVAKLSDIPNFPQWVPAVARHYLAHTEAGIPIRVLARGTECHASTVLRQIRKMENRRDDPLVDAALTHLSARMNQQGSGAPGKGVATPHAKEAASSTEYAEGIEAESARLLKLLCKEGAVLAVAPGMEMAVVVRDRPGMEAERLAVVSQDVARAMALNEWIGARENSGRVVRYRITASGRGAMQRILSGATATKVPQTADGPSRAILSDSPTRSLARRRDRDGRPFLSKVLVQVSERLREDFELAELSNTASPDWRAIAAGDVGDCLPDGFAEGSDPSAAAQRVCAALVELGPGLAEVALRCCCYLEGMEQTEQEMGWSARSGKIVLRIALQRLRRHYNDLGLLAPRLG